MNEPVWVTEEDCLSFHDKLLARFGGGSGVRDKGLLLSALARPQHLFVYEKPSLFDLATAYSSRQTAFGSMAASVMPSSRPSPWRPVNRRCRIFPPGSNGPLSHRRLNDGGEKNKLLVNRGFGGL